MNIKDSLTSAFGQVLFVLIIGFIAYLIKNIYVRFVLKDKEKKLSFVEDLGLSFSKSHFDLTFLYILIGLIIYAIVSTALQITYSLELRSMIMNDSSPYFKILKNGFGANQLLLGLIYCFVQAGASEELLFRGIIGQKLFNKFGKYYGNIIQALLFWLMHLLIFKLVTGYWISFLQLFAFITSFGLGLLMGWVNFRDKKYSIVPSWLVHSLVNFITFLTIAFFM
ncbi:MAG: hypothetical protein COB02_10410 [Candidatus Cloacimonadota bacterium]|nr:MAG: hypothetical protein COB02_10410 [Candidatus Cloacimonadota bacterium]